MATCPKCGQALSVLTDEYDQASLLACDGPICGWSAYRWSEPWTGPNFAYNPVLWWEECITRIAQVLAKMPEYPGRGQY